MERRKEWLFLAAVSIGVLNKETALFLLPVYFVFIIRRGIKVSRPWAAAVVVVPFSIWLLLHILIQPANQFSYLSELFILLKARFGNGLEGLRHEAAEYTFSTWGPLLFLLFSPIQRSVRWLMKEEHLVLWVVLVYGQTLFASDTSRLVVYAFPVVILLALENLQYVAQVVSAPAAVLGIGMILAQIVYFHPFVLGSSVYLIVIWLVLVAMIWSWHRSGVSNKTQAE
jgi:hypothetical protein